MEPHLVTEDPIDLRALEAEIAEIPTDLASRDDRSRPPQARPSPSARRVRGVVRAHRLTALLGLAPALRGAWVVSGIFLAALIGFVGLAVYGQRIEAERRHLAKLKAAEELAHADDDELPMVKYLSEDELAQYRDALAEEYQGAHLAAEA